MTDNVKKQFIEFMLDSGVLRFGEFKTKSGRLSPYFINTGLYTTGRQIRSLGGFYADALYKAVGDGYDALFGPAYKGIPIACMTAAATFEKYGIDRQFLYNRKEAKDHGEGGTIVGYVPKPNDRIVILEDVVTAGTSVRETLPILASFGAEVKNMVISVDRCEKGNGGKTAKEELSEEFGIKTHSIVSVADIHEYLSGSEELLPYARLMEEYMDRYCVL